MTNNIVTNGDCLTKIVNPTLTASEIEQIDRAVSEGICKSRNDFVRLAVLMKLMSMAKGEDFYGNLREDRNFE